MKQYRPKIRSRHGSHDVLRGKLERLPVRSVVRFGSSTEMPADYVEINTVESIKKSADKLRMKEAFVEAGVRTAPYVTGKSFDDISAELKKKEIVFPIIAKNRWGSRNTGNTKIESLEELQKWTNGKTLDHYIFEQYKNYLLEYRFHITKNGCFYVCRKALRQGIDPKERWHRHIDTSVWLLETNPNFQRPNSFDLIVADCVKALGAIGADVLSFDVRVQSEFDKKKNRKRKEQKWILIECNSASSMASPTGDEISICAQKYMEILPQLIKEKAGIKDNEEL